jgi:hypothetical protein
MKRISTNRKSVVGTTWSNKVLFKILFSHSGSIDMLIKGREVKLCSEESTLVTIEEIIPMSLSLGRDTGRSVSLLD